MAEYIVNTDREEARWRLWGANYEEYFNKKATRFMGNPVMECIVRCKDCKYYDHVDLFDDEMWWCIRGASDENVFEVKPDGFCAWGERREY